MSCSDLNNAFFILFKHFVCIAVVSRDKNCKSAFIRRRKNSGKPEINRFNGNDGCVKASRMTYHIAVGIIATDKVILAALHGVDNRIRNLCRLHPGALVK